MEAPSTTTIALCDAYVQGIMELNTGHDELYRTCVGDVAIYLRDFRTVGVHAPRQLGRTAWLVARFIKTPDSVLVVDNQQTRELLVANCGAVLNEEKAARIYTAYEVLLGVKDKQYLELGSTTFLLDSHRIFKNIRINPFYRWLAERNGREQWIIAVN